MKKLGFSVAALALAISAGSALAADLPSRKAPPVAPPPAPLWKGFYACLKISIEMLGFPCISGINVLSNLMGKGHSYGVPL